MGAAKVMNSTAIEALENFMVDDTIKGYPDGVAGVPLGQIGAQGWNLLREDLPLPVAVLKAAAVANNSRWMQQFIGLSGAVLCPHGKTTMSPQLFQRQLDDGAWGITMGTVDQVRICRGFGIARIILANQLVGRQGIGYILDELHRDPGFDFYCLVDSVAGVERLAAAVGAHALSRPLQVLLEGGVAGGRTGCRSVEDAVRVAEAVRAAGSNLSLRGVEGFEGLVTGADDGEREDKVTAFLDFLVGLAVRGVAEDWFGPGPVILTAGGSAFYDLVAGRFGEAGIDRETLIVIRSGCYLSHDSAMYSQLFERLKERSAAARALGGGLEPALEVWAVVQSLPEPGLAIVSMGRRDVSFDVALPVPQHWYRAGLHDAPQRLGEAYRVHGLNDQHGYVGVPEDTPLQVGDLMSFGVSHPCTTFDRWQLIYFVDDAYDVTGAIRTFF